MKKVKCESGIEGWEGYLKSVYDSKEEFLNYDEIYGIAKHLGYDDPEDAWRANPLVQGSVIPSDLKVVIKDHPKKSLKKEFIFKHST